MSLTYPKYTLHVVALLAILLCVGVLMFCAGIGGRYYTRYRAGPMQILAGPEEVWCFIQVDRWVRRPGLIVEPKNIAQGHLQYVVALNEEGVKRRTSVSIPNGIDFHPNLSFIFHGNGDTLLYEGDSMGTYRSVYRWRGDHFELLPLTLSESLLHHEGLDKLVPAGIDIPSTRENWTCLCQTRQLWSEPVEFVWHGRTFELHQVHRRSSSSLIVRCQGEKPWEAELVAWDSDEKPLSWSEDDELWRGPRQSGHPR